MMILLYVFSIYSLLLTALRGPIVGRKITLD